MLVFVVGEVKMKLSDDKIAKYTAYIFIMVFIICVGSSNVFFNQADAIDAQWRNDNTISYEQAWNLYSTALTLRNLAFSIAISGVAFLGTGLAFFLQSLPKQSNEILENGFSNMLIELGKIQGILLEQQHNI